MPSVNSSSRPNVWPSSTFTTPSLPTFSIASAMLSPISRSREEMLATRAMSSLPEISLDCDFRFSVTDSTAVSMPRLSDIGFAPAATFFRPSRTMACASTVAVVVPSPATSFVAVATSRTSCAPWFSKTSSTSISRAIVTPSFVIVGAPNFLSRTTYRPFGPSVTLTASARMSTPRWSERRASSLNFSSLCAIRLLRLCLGLGLGGGDLCQDVGLAQDQVLLAAHLDLGAAVLRKDHLVALRDIKRNELAVLVSAGADLEHVAALRLLLCRIRQDDAADRRLFLIEDFNDDAVAQRLQIHATSIGNVVGTRTCGVPTAIIAARGSSSSRFLALLWHECQTPQRRQRRGRQQRRKQVGDTVGAGLRDCGAGGRADEEPEPPAHVHGAQHHAVRQPHLILACGGQREGHRVLAGDAGRSDDVDDGDGDGRLRHSQHRQHHDHGRDRQAGHAQATDAIVRTPDRHLGGRRQHTGQAQ